MAPAWLYHDQLSVIATYRHEIYASANMNGYPLVLIAFPVIGLIVSAMSVACDPHVHDRGQFGTNNAQNCP
jgi:hypothetical protein